MGTPTKRSRDRQSLLGCYGINPKTRQRVGSRHRWRLGWGKGRCEWCGRTVEEATYREVDEDKA